MRPFLHALPHTPLIPAVWSCNIPEHNVHTCAHAWAHIWYAHIKHHRITNSNQSIYFEQSFNHTHTHKPKETHACANAAIRTSARDLCALRTHQNYDQTRKPRALRWERRTQHTQKKTTPILNYARANFRRSHAETIRLTPSAQSLWTDARPKINLPADPNGGRAICVAVAAAAAVAAAGNRILTA